MDEGLTNAVRFRSHFPGFSAADYRNYRMRNACCWRKLFKWVSIINIDWLKQYRFSSERILFKALSLDTVNLLSLNNNFGFKQS